MRTVPQTLWDLWYLGGPLIGDDGAPHGRVTVETGRDNVIDISTTGGTVGTFNKGPVRWFQRADNGQTETEVPNVENINIDRSLDQDAATCTITLANQWHYENGEMAPSDMEIGQPGYFTFNRGSSPDAQARWGHEENAWSDVLVPNALIRTYQGYGGRDLTVSDAIDAGNIILTGVWLVDEVRITTNGRLELKCRDMGKLLIEQQLYPPLIPQAEYPLQYCRWSYTEHVTPPTQTWAPRPMYLQASSNDPWYGYLEPIHGHSPYDCLDGNPDTFWLSVGNGSPTLPYAVEWIQFEVNADINLVHLWPYAGNYQCFISVYENGAWVEDGGVIAYNPAGIGRYTGIYAADIPYVTQFGTSWEAPMEAALPRIYNAQYVRFTFTNLQNTPWGPYSYRAGLREAGVSLFTATPGSTEFIKGEGNYKDYSDIIKELLLWSGWWFYDDTEDSGYPTVYGNIESTGAYSEECIPEDVFDKKPVIDAIHTLKEIVGYIAFVDDEGAFHFESPNIWTPGNFMDTGERTTYIPELDEMLTMTDYAVSYTDSSARSEIIISSSDPTQPLDDTITTKYIPPTADILRGIVKPAVWVNEVFTNAEEQVIMAELIALYSFLAQRQGSVTALANPGIQINDQIRIYERQTSESYIHYVRGISTNMDLRSGIYTMTLNTHWMGDENDWAVVVP